jgi:3-oxoacyl-[acyl-carrier-protein] synthase III
MQTYTVQLNQCYVHKQVSPFLIPALISNTASGVVAIEFKAKGPNFGVVSACATGTHAIGTAIDFMLRGEADVMLAGGSEAAMTPLCFAGFASMKAMVTSFNDEPQRASRPFDKDRAGFVMGEGAGVVLLETEGTSVSAYKTCIHPCEHTQCIHMRILCFNVKSSCASNHTTVLFLVEQSLFESSCRVFVRSAAVIG